MHTELYNAIKAINIENLTNSDKEDLLNIFRTTNNSKIRNQIALIFAELHYNDAVPYIIKKINDKNTFNNNGTLVFSLEDLDVKRYFLTIIRIICEQEYEARLSAFVIVEKYAPSISKATRTNALKILKRYQIVEEGKEIEKYENSTLHFIDATIKLLG